MRAPLYDLIPNKEITITVSFKPQTAYFTINPPNTTLHIQKTINLPTSIQERIFLQHREYFNKIFNLCRWSSDTANEVPISLAGNYISILYTEVYTLEDKFQALINQK